MNEFGSHAAWTGDRATAPDAMGTLIGRDSELTALRGLVRDAAAGRGRSVWIEGEPGIGKSALLSAGLAEAESVGCQLFIARTDEASQTFPLRPLLEALHVSPDSTDPVRAEIAERLWGPRRGGLIGGPASDAAELLLILVDRLCATGPVVLAVDDLQWADETSLAAWSRLARAVAQLPLLLVAAARPVPRRYELDRLRRSLAGYHTVDVPLIALSPGAVADLVRRMLSMDPGRRLRNLLGQTAGNPLYVRELVDALVRENHIEVHDRVADVADGSDSGPMSLAAAINARLDFLSTPVVRTLRMAALLGAEFRVDGLSTITGEAPASLTDVIEEALKAGVLAESGVTLAFRHGLIRHALYESIPAALREALHQQAARSLASAGAAAEAVAQQLAAAPQHADDWTIDWLVGAGPALIARAPQVAVALLRRARQSTHPLDDRRIALEVHLVDAQSQLGHYDEVELLARPLLAVAPDPEIIGRMAWALAYALRVLGRYDDALTVIGEALLVPAVSASWRARLRAAHAFTLFATARYEEAQRAAEDAEAEGRSAGDRVAVGWALCVASQVQEFHHVDQAAALRLREEALAVVGDDPETYDLRLMLLGNCATALWNLGRMAEASRVLGQALALAEQTATPQRLASLRAMAAETAFLDGRWDDVLAELEAIDDAQELPTFTSRWRRRGLTALIAVHRDDKAAVAAQLGGDDDVAPLGLDQLFDKLIVAQALVAERDGHPRRALTIFLDFFDPDSTLQFSGLVDCMWAIEVVRLALVVGDHAVAQAATRACAAEAQRQGLPDALVCAQQCQGMVEADAEQLQSAADSFEKLGFGHFRAAALTEVAAVLAQKGDAVGARSAYRDAVVIYTELRAEWDLRRLDSRMRALGIRRGVRRARNQHTTGWDALTLTESKIARLVAAGRTNPEIAAELYMSRRTVEAHVSHILNKLDCRSRVDIARQTASA